MFSQFFVLSLRGDTILHKDCKFTYLFPFDFISAWTWPAPARKLSRRVRTPSCSHGQTKLDLARGARVLLYTLSGKEYSVDAMVLRFNPRVADTLAQSLTGKEIKLLGRDKWIASLSMPRDNIKDNADHACFLNDLSHRRGMLRGSAHAGSHPWALAQS